MKLKKEKGPWRITFDSNPDLCNLRCIMCDTNSIYNKSRRLDGTKRLIPFSVIENTVRDCADHIKEIIPSTMGEPLLYPDFKEIVNLCKKHEIKLNLTTNGTFPGLGVERWAHIILPVVSDVKISINGATKETAESVMTGIDFERQIENIRKLIDIRDEMMRGCSNNPTITFQVTYMKKNLEELPKILNMAIDMGVDRVKGHHLWITWPEIESESLKKDRTSILRWNETVDKLMEIKKRRGSNIKLDNFYKLNPDKENGSTPEDWTCPFLGREAWIAWDGTFNVCCAPDNLRRTLGYYGNVDETDFATLWDSDEYAKLVEKWGNYEVCKKCNMMRPKNEREY